MIADYHVHSLCSPDGVLSMADMAAAEVGGPVEEICFTDHVDTESWAGYVAEDTYDWAPICAAYEQAAERWGDRLRLRLGAEVGEMMTHPDRADRYLDDAPELDFVIGSLHLMPPQFALDFSEVGGVLHRWDEAVSGYLEQQLAHIAWGRFSVLGHLTFPLRFSRGLTFDGHMDEVEQVLRALVEKGIGLECNTTRGQMFLPDGEILRIYRRLGGEIVTLGTDAHRGRDIGRGITEGMELLRGCGFRYVCTYEKMKPIFHKL